MDEIIIKQLAELASAFNKIGIKPVICGGLGVYLCFYKNEGVASNILRDTYDIDLMITKEMVLENLRQNAIAEIITGELEYIVREDGRHFRFKKDPNRQLDILAQPMEGFKVREHRVKFVKSKLHGFFTEEALFIDEDLRTVELQSDKAEDKIEVQVPSPTNLLILKLCAFNDRDREKEIERAQAHAYDIYITITLSANMEDFKEGQRFLARHKDWQVIQKVKSIVDTKFDSVEKPGWQRVLEARGFYPNLNLQQKRGELEQAKNRLVRWFTLLEQVF